MSHKPITRDDLVADVQQDIATARADQRDATAAGNTFTAEQHAATVDAYLDERQQYDY